MNYTEEQQRAIDARGHNILVAAAAGSGKTRVLVQRIIQAILRGELDVDAMLVVTFTNAAAAEMRERIGLALQEELDRADDPKEADRLERQAVLLTGANISTFHSFCQKVIRQNIDRLDVDPQFRLASEQEMVLLRQDTLEELLEAKYQRPEREDDLTAWQDFVSFSDDYGDDHGDRTLQEAILQLYAFSQSQPYPEAWLDKQANRFAKKQSLGETVWFRELYPQMQRQLQNMASAMQKLKSLFATADFFDAEEGEQICEELVHRETQLYQMLAEQLQNVAEAPEAGAWDVFCEQAKKVLDSLIPFTKKPFTAKPFRKGPESFLAFWQQFKDQRNAIKDNFKKWQAAYASQSEAEILAGIQQTGKATKILVQLTKDYIEALQAAKKERDILDFNDLEHYALAVLCADPEKLQRGIYVPTEAAQNYREQFQTVMVDEYQDTNGVQEAILSLVARENNRFIVGDVKQSIYRFRMADPTLFQQKYESFVEAPQEAGQGELITMSKNFRSRKEVLSSINYIFDQIMTREGAEIAYDAKSRLYFGSQAFTEHEHTLAGPTEVDLILRSEADDLSQPAQPMEKDTTAEESEELTGFRLEAQYIATRIAQLMAERPFVLDRNGYRPIEYRDIAVLMRAVKGKANILLETLRKNSIPAYADVDGGYFEATEVRLIIAVLTIIDNVRQDIPLAAVLASPIGGFSMEEIAHIRLAAQDGDLYDGLLASFASDSPLSADLRERTAAFQQELANWRRYAVSHSVPELIWTIYRETGYYDYVGSLRGGVLRQANLRMLADRAADYERTNYRGLFRFLRFIEALKKRDTDLSVARTLGASEDVVRIMSIHKSKGLEFPVVIVADIAKGFNLMDLNKTVLLHKDLGIGMKGAEHSDAGRQTYDTLPRQAIAQKITAEAKAEEMRVLYVAMTRAKEKLILTGTINAEKLAKKTVVWQTVERNEQKQLTYAGIQGAGSYLDWLGPALIAHVDGLALRKLAGEVTDETEAKARSQGNFLDFGESDAHYEIHCIPSHEIAGVAQEEEDDALLQAVEHLQPMPATAAAEKVDACLSWHYDMRGLADVPAKLTVTELKHRFSEYDELAEDMPGVALIADEVATVASEEEGQNDDVIARAEENGDFPRPKFMQENRRRLSATERGTIMHTVMQHLDLHGDLSFAGIKAQVEAMEQSGVLPAGAKDVVYIKGVQNFVWSEVGKNLRQAKRVWRELPFSRMLQAQRFYPEVKDADEKIFTQGVIDLLFEDKEGRLILVDYKTDRNPDPQQALQRYQLQVELYSEAVAEILQRPVAARYLYLLQSAQFVPVLKKNLKI